LGKMQRLVGMLLWEIHVCPFDVCGTIVVGERNVEMHQDLGIVTRVR